MLGGFAVERSQLNDLNRRCVRTNERFTFAVPIALFTFCNSGEAASNSAMAFWNSSSARHASNGVPPDRT
jgi:hypothetical protein